MQCFFKDFFGIDTASLPSNSGSITIQWPTFEEALGIIELAITRKESYKGYLLGKKNPGGKLKNLEAVRENLIFLIAKILDEKLKQPKSKADRPHKNLVKRLSNCNKLENTCFISLNYDILIDNALEIDNSDNGVSPDYGIKLFNNSRTGKEWRECSNKIKLYKLHGSLNWLYCPTCIKLYHYPGEKAAASEEKSPCSKCDTPIIPLLVPPTFFKVMENYYLQQIWHKAESAFLEADKIYFCGYSFPDADIHIKYLIKRAEMNRKNGWAIFAVNNRESLESNSKKEYLSDHHKNELWDRYHRFFNQEKSKINFTTLCFQDFCKSDIEPDNIIQD